MWVSRASEDAAVQYDSDGLKGGVLDSDTVK